MTKFIIAQLIGAIAVFCTFLLFQYDRRSTMLKIGIVGALLYTIHFYLLGARTGAAMNLISCSRAAVFLHYGKKQRPQWIMWLYIFLFASAAILTWSDIKSLLPGVAMIISTIAFWQLKPRRIRLLSLISPPCWFIYNLLVGSYPGMLSEVVNLTSNSIAIGRFDVKFSVPKRLLLGFRKA